MKPPILTHEEWAWTYAILTQWGKGLPRAGKTGYKGNGWDVDDLYETARSDISFGRDEVWKVIEERATMGAWPKVRPELARRINARWKAALNFSKGVLQVVKEDTGKAPDVVKPNDPEKVLKELILDYWDSFLVDNWLSDNLPDMIYFDSYDEGPSDDFSEWEHQVRSGKYKRKI